MNRKEHALPIPKVHDSFENRRTTPSDARRNQRNRRVWKPPSRYRQGCWLSSEKSEERPHARNPSPRG